MTPAIDLHTAAIYASIIMAGFGFVIAGGVRLYRLAIIPIQAAWAKVSLGLDRTETMWTAWQPNGGSSLSDRLVRLSNDVGRLTAITSAEAESSGHPRVEFKIGGTMEFANAPALAALGMNLDEATGHGWLNALPSMSRVAVLDQIANAETHCNKLRAHIVVQRTPQERSGGSGTSALLSLFPLTDVDGKTNGFYGAIDLIHEK